MTYTPNQLAYIHSVEGHAHQTAVELIGRLDAEIAALRRVADHLRIVKRENDMPVVGIVTYGTLTLVADREMRSSLSAADVGEIQADIEAAQEAKP